MLGDFHLAPAVTGPGADGAAAETSAEEALRHVLQGWMEIVGPVTAAGLAARIGLSVESVEQGLNALEVSGVVLQGHFSPGTVADPPRGMV